MRTFKRAPFSVVDSDVSEDLDELVRISKLGDRTALQQLLGLYFGPLAVHIDQRIPMAVQSQVDSEDVVQQAFVQVVRDINGCRATTETSFFAWVRAIAEHRLSDAIRSVGAKKRQGDRTRIVSLAPNSSQMIDILELLSAGSHRPSHSAIRHEAIDAVHEAIQGLPEAYRRAVELRWFEGKSLDEIASAMNSSPRAVQGLIDRGRKKMRTMLGNLSRYE